jgi:hypothetical protein
LLLLLLLLLLKKKNLPLVFMKSWGLRGRKHSGWRRSLLLMLKSLKLEMLLSLQLLQLLLLNESGVLSLRTGLSRLMGSRMHFCLDFLESPHAHLIYCV